MSPLTEIPCQKRPRWLHVFALFNLMSVFNVLFVSGDVKVNQGNESILFYLDRMATFGPELSETGLTGYLISVGPVVNKSSCTDYKPGIPNNDTSKVWIALIRRNGCKFDDMVLNAQKLGYQGVIIQNHFKDDSLVAMGGDSHMYDVTIPSVFVGWTSGYEIGKKYCYQCSFSNYTITINNNSPQDFKSYILWPFAIVVGTCFILMLSFMIFKWCRDISKRKKSRLSTKVLKKIPTKKFKKGDDYDVCAICLDDYEEGDKLRILPCSHAYHCVCIDPWLTKNKKTCPVCKRKVIPGSNPDSDSDSDEDNGNQSTSERTPLLGNNNNTRPARRSTFDNSGLPETMRPMLRTVNEVNPDSSDSDSDSEEDDNMPRPMIHSQENVVNRAVVNRGYFKSSDEEDDEDEQVSDGDTHRQNQESEVVEENRQGIIANVSIVNVDQTSESRTVNHVV
ncbi:E3 ubiquitin-protein ligase RNF13-like [Pecten maximus]|uniref:E3 ubiquitin-protein ligase RNF13-like n=1 Tax=Pecten maximus TaxID=6579 RepID=UPI001457FE1D|nr:E3 ubiquitin-protein ligase RNF13-like [Pecten maximus]